MTKKKRILIVLAVVAALAVAFCLWYTRPRTFEDLLDGRAVTDLAVVGIHGYNDKGTARSDSYTLSQTNQGQEAAQGLIQILSGSRYRTSLRSLLPLPDQISDTSTLYVYVMMGLDDGSGLSLIFINDQVRFDSSFITSGEDGLTAALFDYLAEHGVSGSAGK